MEKAAPCGTLEELGDLWEQRLAESWSQGDILRASLRRLQYLLASRREVVDQLQSTISHTHQIQQQRAKRGTTSPSELRSARCG